MARRAPLLRWAAMGGVAATLAVLLPAPAAAFGAPGTIDPSFGDNGRVVTQTALNGYNWLDSHVNIAEGPDGTIVAAVGKTLLRYLPDGDLDPNFGDGGRLTVTEPEGLPFKLSDMDVDPDGRVVLFGQIEIPGIRLLATYDGATIPLTQAAIVRYDADGALDRTFGSGDGVVITDFGQPPYYQGPPPPPGESRDPRYTKAVAGIASGNVNRYGGLTVLGRITVVEGCIRSAAQSADRLVARLTPSGDLDPSFGGGDGVVSDMGFSDIWGLAETSSGDELLAGRSIASRLCKASPPGEAPVPELVSRLTPDGSLDASFATNGFRPIPFTGPVSAMAVDGGGRLSLLAGSTVVRFRQTGGLDRRFGDRGAAIVPAARVDLRALSPIAQGRLVLAGTHLIPPPPAAPAYKLFPQSFVVTLRTASGHPDRKFGHDGWITTRFGKRSSALAQAAFIDTEGRLVVAGAITRPDLAPTGGIALARYRLGG
jgi:uncharacterized delta-60 repeat protein